MFRLEDHGTLVLVRPLTDDVRAWLEANVEPDAAWFGSALVVGHRYVDELVAGLVDEGFVGT